MKLDELDAYVKTVSYDELMKMLSIILAESTKRMSRRAIDGVEGFPE